MYLCYYNCILTKAQSQLIITPSISNLHKPILFKDSMFRVTGLPHWLWKYPHQTSLRPSKGIKGVVWCWLLSTPAQPSQGQTRVENKGEETQWPHGSPLGDRPGGFGSRVVGREGHLAESGKLVSEPPLESARFTHSVIHPSIQQIHQYIFALCFVTSIGTGESTVTENLLGSHWGCCFGVFMSHCKQVTHEKSH